MAININTIEDLINFADGVYGTGASDNYLEVQLNADLDFSNYEGGNYSWKGCTGQASSSTSRTYYYCYFYGNGHKISNIYYGAGPGPANWTFIGLAGGSTIEDLTLDSIYVIANSIYGITYGRAAVVRNCHVRGVLEGLSSGDCIGITGQTTQTSGQYIQCSFSGTLYAPESGQCVGIGAGAGTYINCQVVANIRTNTGAIYGLQRQVGSTKIVNCEFRGVMSSRQNAAHILGTGTYVNCLGIIEEGSNMCFPESESNNYYNCGVCTEDTLYVSGTNYGTTTTSISAGSSTKNISVVVDGVTKTVAAINGDRATYNGTNYILKAGKWQLYQNDTYIVLPDGMCDVGPTPSDLTQSSDWLDRHSFIYKAI